MSKKIKNTVAFLNKLESHKYLVLLLLLINLSATAQFGGGPSPVKVSKVQSLMMAPVRLIPADVQAKFVTKIKAESRGIINQLVDIGSFVEQGEVLAELTDTQSKLRQQELKDAVKSARAKYQFLKSENARLLDLVKKNLISNSELDKNQSDLLAAQSELAQSSSRLDQYKDQVAKLNVLAPFNGFVMQQFAQPGQLLNSGDDALEFMQANNLEIVVNVPFQYKSQISKGSIWKILTTDGKIYESELSKFIPAATGQSHTIEVHLLIDNNDLWPGESVNVEVPKEAARKVIAVPRDALVIRKSGTYVYKVVEGKSHKVDVITGTAQRDMIEVKGLLSEGDVVIVRGNERLRNDQAVKIIDN